jgi:hypothetical protein
MPVVDPIDLAFLRDLQPPRVEWFVAIAPYGDPVFEARINDGAIGRGTMEVPFDQGVGILGLVEPGMTLWIGSTGSSYDLGSVRIRSVTGSTSGVFGVAENDEILWADDLFLTVPGESGFREPWSVFPRMTESGGSVTFYKDYDRTYVNEGDHLPPKANAGPAAIAFIDPTSGLATLQWIGEDSYPTETAGAPLVAWAWQFPNGTPPTSPLEGTRAAPIQVTWNTPGFHYVKLTVEDTLGTTGTTHVPVWVFDESSPEVPLRRVEVVDQAGSTAGGWSARLKVFDVGPSDFPDRSLVALGVRTWYQGNPREIGGYPERENVRFVGWVDRETLTYDAAVGTVEFEAQGLSGVMEQMPSFSLYLEENGSPGEWYEMVDNNADRMSHHILEYHSTINQITHVNRPGEGNTRKIESAGFPDTNLLAQIQENLWMDIMCGVASDRQGILQITRNPQMMVAAARDGVASVCTLSNSDWMGTIDVPMAHVPELGWVELGGFGYGTPYLSRAPGAAPLQQEQAIRVNGCILDTADPQTNANWWSGLTLTQKNVAYPKLPVNLKGFWPVFDPAIQEWVRLNFVDPEGRRPFENARFLVREASFQDDRELGTTTTKLTLESESELLYGETVDIPPPPPPEPPEPPTPPIGPPGEPWAGPVKACVAWTHDQLGYTSDLLLHHCASAATAGTGGTDLYDTAVDFVVLGIAIGDAVEEVGSSSHPNNITTVASVVSAHHITLTADIGLVNTSDYHICGAQWVDIKGTITGTILHFIYAQTGENTVGGWVLTTTNVYYTSNILTTSPAWAIKLTLAQAAAGSVGATAGWTAFKWIHGHIEESGFVIVSLAHDQSLNPVGAYLGGYVHTHDFGLNWTWASMPGGSNRVTMFSGLEVSENTGKVWGRRSHDWPPGESRIYYSLDKGGSFSFYNVQNLGNPADSFHQEIYNPFAAGDNILYIDIWDPWLSGRHGKSANSGSTFSWLTAAGYTSISGKSGIVGWMEDGDDVLMVWNNVTGSHCLLRSGDAGASWANIGNADGLFGAGFGTYYGTVALVSSTWTPDRDVVFWVGLQASSAAQVRRICYTQDDGVAWYSKMGNWYTIFGSWSGATPVSPIDNTHGNVGCCPLPRVGANK